MSTSSLLKSIKATTNASISGFNNQLAAQVPLRNIPLTNIDPMPDNEYYFPQDEDVILGLMREIQKSGFNEPVTVVPNPDNLGHFLCLSGHQRIEAVKRLGWDSVPCYVRQDMSLEDQQDFFFAANVVSRKVSPLSMARIAKASIEEYKKRKAAGDPDFDYTDKYAYAAERCGVSRTRVQRYLAILKFPEDIQARCSSPDFPYTTLFENQKMTPEQMEALSLKLKAFDKENAEKKSDDQSDGSDINTIKKADLERLIYEVLHPVNPGRSGVKTFTHTKANGIRAEGSKTYGEIEDMVNSRFNDEEKEKLMSLIRELWQYGKDEGKAGGADPEYGAEISAVLPEQETDGENDQ